MFNLGAADQVFSTDYYTAPAGLAWSAGVTGQSPKQGHPALPALWWLGFVIALIAIRVMSDHAQ